ncbi:hypothetical protein FB451DRAFT_1415085 [Mycena latifolia]|nr:hypothetical protein FB451DRAFT_1415085 [Mycena latifolia]
MAQLGSSDDEWLRSAILIARAFTAAADGFPVPYAKAAFDAVLVLLETVERGDEDDAWEDEVHDQDYHWHNEEGGGWGEETEVNEYNEDNRQAASEPDPPNLCCPICCDTVCRPVATLCMHIFCDECIYNVLRQSSLACPLCRATITEPPEPDAILDRYLEQMIADGAVTGPSGGRSSPYTWRDVNFSQQ